MAGGGDVFTKKISNFLEKKFNFTLLHLNFPCYYCSIDLKRHSEHSVLCHDTSSLVVPTFDKKVTEYLCSGWVLFLQTNLDFLTSHF